MHMLLHEKNGVCLNDKFPFIRKLHIKKKLEWIRGGSVLNRIRIRQEQPADYDAVYHIVKEAFESAEHTDGNEQNLVVKLRKSKSFIPELSLVAVEDGKIVGHILFTRALVNGVEVLALAPLSVLPEYQRMGIGMSLIQRGHSIADKLGYKYSVVLGHSKYYPKAGYVPASQYGVKAPFEVEDNNFMIVCFGGNDKKLNGIMEYDEAFGI